MKNLLTIISLFILSNTITAQDDLTTALPKDVKTVTGVLPNGIRYYIRHNSKPEKRAEFRLAVNAGSTSENDDQQGLAHLVEHMAFNGTEHFKKSELVDYLESVGTKFGAHLNAYTSFDETVYMIQLPTDTPSIVLKGLQILEDWAHSLTFDSLEIEKERGVVVEEWRLGQGANERMRRKYWPFLFKDSRYADRLPIGKKEIIEKCSQTTLKRFYTDWYRPDLMAVIAVGDFDVKQMEESIRKQFSSIPSKADARKLQTYGVPDNAEIIITTATDKEARYGDVEIIYKQPKETQVTVGDYRRGIAQQLFTAMMDARTSELERLADPPFLNASSGYGSLVRNKYSYSVSAICKEDGIERALTTIATENERVRRYGFTQSELDRQKNEMLRGMEMAYTERDKTESRNLAREYVSNFLTSEPMPGIEYEYNLFKKYMPGITLEEINAFTTKWITEGKNCIVLITAPEKETTKMPSDETIKSIMASMKSLELKKYEDKVVDKPLLAKIPDGSKVAGEKKINEFNITEWMLGNGVKIISKPTDFKNDEVIFSSYAWGGWSVYPDKDFLSAAYADEIVDEAGLGPFDASSLEKKLSGKIVSCSPYIDELQHGFNGRCSPRDLETLFQLIYGYNIYPRKDSVAFQSWIEKQKGVLLNRNADPNSVFGDTMRYVMSGYNYHFRPRTVESLKEISLDRAYEIYKERFKNPVQSVYFFVGNFNTDSLKYYSEKYLGGLPAVGDKTMWKDIGVKYPKGTVEKTVKMGQEPKSAVVLRWNMPFDYNRKNRSEVNALNKLVSIRLREVLREEKSGVYGVSFNSISQHFPEQKLEQVISFSCSPENVEMLIKAALDVITEVKEKGCQEKNLVKIKETAIRERETYLKENGFWLNSISSNFQNGENILDLLHYNEWVNSLITADFVTFAKKYLQQENYARMVLMPAN
jgi:zinc protease